MRIAAALAIIAATVSSPASAQQSCPIGKATYLSKEAPDYRMEFGAGGDVLANTGVTAAIFGPHRELLAAIVVTWSMGYSVAYYGAASPFVEGEHGGRIVGFSRDFSYEGPPGYASGAAPYALVLSDIGSWLYNSTKDGAAKSIPEGAWILAECR